MPDLAGLLDSHGLLALFLSAFISSTLLPSGSEVLLGAMVVEQQWSISSLVLWATLGNTLGSMLTFIIGWWARRHKAPEDFTRRREQTALAWLQHHGHWALLLAWTPVVGDVLCLLAGWLKMEPIRACIFIGLGKLARYSVIALLINGVI